MKKIFLAGALAASMLISSSAFAADLSASYADGKVSVDTSFITTEMINAGKQMTVVVLDGNGSTVTTDTIRYIDQETAAAGIFQDMGLLVKSTETAIPNGTYTVKVGGDGITDLYVGTVTVGEQGTPDTIKVGDINDSGFADTTDALSLIAYVLNSANDGAADNKYAIGTSLKINETESIVVGDVNGSDVADTTDALSIIAYVLNSANDGAADNQYYVGQDVSVIIE